MKTLSATPRPYDRWKAETLSFLHVLLVWVVKLASLLNKMRQSWTIHQKPSDKEIGEKRIDIRRFLGYVCHIAKVRVRISFGWVSLFAQKFVFF